MEELDGVWEGEGEGAGGGGGGSRDGDSAAVGIDGGGDDVGAGGLEVRDVWGNRRFRRLGPIRGRLPPAGLRGGLAALRAGGLIGEGGGGVAAGSPRRRFRRWGGFAAGSLEVWRIGGLVLRVGRCPTPLRLGGDGVALGVEGDGGLVFGVEAEGLLDEGVGFFGELGVGGDGDVGGELGLDGVEEFGCFGGGFDGEAGDGGDAVGNLDCHAFAHGEAADVAGVDGLELVVGAVTGAAHEVGNVCDDAVGDVLRGAGGFGEAAVAVWVEEARVLIAALLGVVDDVLDGLQRKCIVIWPFVWYSDGVKGGLPPGCNVVPFGVTRGHLQGAVRPDYVCHTDGVDAIDRFAVYAFFLDGFVLCDDGNVETAFEEEGCEEPGERLWPASQA